MTNLNTAIKIDEDVPSHAGNGSVAIIFVGGLGARVVVGDVGAIMEEIECIILEKKKTTCEKTLRFWKLLLPIGFEPFDCFQSASLIRI